MNDISGSPQPKRKRRRRRNKKTKSSTVQIVTSKVYGINVDALLLPGGNSLENTCTEEELTAAGADIGWLVADEIIVDLGVGLPNAQQQAFIAGAGA